MPAKNPYPMCPGDVLDFSWPWTAWLPEGVTISSHEMTSGEHVSVQSSGPNTLGITALVALASAAPIGTLTSVSCSIVTSAGQRITRHLVLQAARV